MITTMVLENQITAGTTGPISNRRIRSVSVTRSGWAAFACRSRTQPNEKKVTSERNKRQTAAVAGQESLSLMFEVISKAGKMPMTAKHKPKRVQDSFMVSVILVSGLTPELSR